MESSTANTDSACPVELEPATGQSSLVPVIEKHETALLMLCGFAGFSAMIGFLYNILRRRVFKDFHSLDVVFDAGGRVSVSLTAVTVTSQLLWPADFLQSPTLASKVGIGGSLWYTMAVVLSVLIFPVLCIQLKTRAPGAKTFPQIAYARFGKPAHLMFCVIALFTNMVIVCNLILAGKAAIEVLTKNSSNEFIVMILAVLFGSYCLIGGLGTTFYISYFNTALIFISTSMFILKITYLAEPDVKEVTSPDSLHEAMSCLRGPDGNYDNSFLTFRTKSGIIYGIVMWFMTIAIIFCDQANWQSRIAAKPKEGILGFFISGFLWFAIPTSLSFVTSMTYKSMSFRNGTSLLTDEEIDQGYITPFVIRELLGKEGCYLLLTMLSMTLMSTGSGEVMSVSSILVYDIYKIYINPFRINASPTECVLCGRFKFPSLFYDRKDDLCECPSSVDCATCKADISVRISGTMPVGYRYKCHVHGKYRHYEDMLLRYKSWCMIWIIICIVPFGMLVIESGVNLNWVYMAAQVFIAPFITPLFLTISWAGAKSKALIAGGVIGLVSAVTGMFSVASTYDGGLRNFLVNTTQDWSLLTGLVAGFMISSVVCVGGSICLKYRAAFIDLEVQNFSGSSLRLKRPSIVLQSVHILEEGENDKSVNKRDRKDVAGIKDKTDEDDNAVIQDKSDEDSHDLNENPGNSKNSLFSDMQESDYEWLKTMCIDNPLNPYRNLYRKKLDKIKVGNIVTSKHMETIFKDARKISYAGAIISLITFFIFVPAVALGQTVLGAKDLAIWISVCQHWCLIGTVLVVVVPPVQECIQIWRQYSSNKKGQISE